MDGDVIYVTVRSFCQGDVIYVTVCCFCQGDVSMSRFVVSVELASFFFTRFVDSVKVMSFMSQFDLFVKVTLFGGAGLGVGC